MSSNGMPDHDPGSRTISEATRCLCGHRWDEHNGSGRQDLGESRCDLCCCWRFDPDDTE